MRTKQILLFLPLLLALVLLQSAFWVPTYGSQSATNSGRLETFVDPRPSDFKLLNPMLNSDATTAELMDRRIFDRLIESNEKLDVIPWLAESWTVTEEAFIAVRPERRLPDGTQVTGASLRAALEAAFRGALSDLAPKLRAVELVPAAERTRRETALEQKPGGKSESVSATLRARLPERLKLTLDAVEPALFERLEPALGQGYFRGMDVKGRIDVDPPAARPAFDAKLDELLEVGEHNSIVTFKLRPGVRFHDGHPFTSRDVRFTYQAIIDPKNASPRASTYESIDRIEVPDELTVRVVYKRLNATSLLDWTMMGMVPEHLLNRQALEREMNARNIPPEQREKFSIRDSDFNRSPVGTGRFKFVTRVPDQYTVLERNDDYWGERARYKRIISRVIPDRLAQELELHAGSIDRYEAEPHQAARLRTDPKLQVVSRGEGYYMYIAYNLRRPPFDDVRVRRALSLAVNVDDIIKYVLFGEGKRASGPYFSNTPFNDPETPLQPYDPARALELLQEVGYRKNARGILEKDGKPFEFTLISNVGNPQRKAVVTIVQEAWRRIGVHCTTQLFEFPVFLEQFVHVRKFDAFVLGWIGADITPDRRQIWHSSQTGNYKLNFPGYASPEADALIDKILLEYDRNKQIALAHQLHRRIAEDVPYTFLYEPSRPYALDARIAIDAPELGSGRGRFLPITRTPSGEIDYYFPRWFTRPGQAAVAE
jgi:ABC-type transport system substrate-binding protein